MSDDGLLADQIAYYRARAPEYDEWWRREGRYATQGATEADWRPEVEQAAAWLDDVGPSGHVLELAAGTGNWTVELVRHADRVTCVDSSPETLAINRAKLGSDAGRVDHVVADVFAWDPPRAFDDVFFSFWISHVPDDHLAEFFALVDRALAPGGRVIMIDNRGGPSDETGVVEYPGGSGVAARGGLSERELNDGRRFTIVKVYRSPERLDELLGPLGWRVTGGNTGTFFTYAVAERRT